MTEKTRIMTPTGYVFKTLILYKANDFAEIAIFFFSNKALGAGLCSEQIIILDTVVGPIVRLKFRNFLQNLLRVILLSHGTEF